MSLQEARSRAAAVVNGANQQHETSNKKRSHDKSRDEGQAPGGKFKRSKNLKTRDKRTVGKIKNPCWLCKNGDQHDWSNCWSNKFNKKNRLVDGKIPDNLRHLVKPKDEGHNQAIVAEDVDELTTGFAHGDKGVEGKHQADPNEDHCHPLTRYSNETNCHHLDCFTIQDLENRHPNTNQELGATSSATSSTIKNPSGLSGGSQIPLRARRDGLLTNPRESNSSVTEAECLDEATRAISHSLFVDEMALPVHDDDCVENNEVEIIKNSD